MCRFHHYKQKNSKHICIIEPKPRGICIYNAKIMNNKIEQAQHVS